MSITISVPVLVLLLVLLAYIVSFFWPPEEINRLKELKYLEAYSEAPLPSAKLERLKRFDQDSQVIEEIDQISKKYQWKISEAWFKRALINHILLLLAFSALSWQYIYELEVGEASLLLELPMVVFLLLSIISTLNLAKGKQEVQAMKEKYKST